MAKAATKTKPSPRATAPSIVSNPAPNSLPKSLINVLPVGAKIIQHVQAIEALFLDLQRQLAAAEQAGPVSLARAFVVLHRLHERMLSDEKALKPFKALWRETKELKIPAAFEQAGVPSVALDEGFRVGVSVRTVASVKPGQKDAAFTWLEANGAGDLIQETINSGTLSAFAKEKGESNIDLPDDIFTVARLPNASVTKT